MTETVLQTISILRIFSVDKAREFYVGPRRPGRVRDRPCHTRPMAKRPPRPRDPNQLAKLILDITTGEVPNDSPKGPDSAAIQAPRKGGLKGGKARAKKLPSKRRAEIARRAATARWARRGQAGSGQKRPPGHSAS